MDDVVFCFVVVKVMFCFDYDFLLVCKSGYCVVVIGCKGL